MSNLLKEMEARARLEVARAAPYLPFLPYDCESLRDHILRDRFPTLQAAPAVVFCEQDTLACICPDAGVIFIHVLLNAPNTPLPVMRYILTHELVHLVVPPAEIEGRLTLHPPAFWDVERQLEPEAAVASEWLWLHLFSCLRRDREREAIMVKRGWKCLRYGDRMPWAELQAMVARVQAATAAKPAPGH